jgi:hypothetical protein
MTSFFPTSQNKETFKNFLRENKDTFSSSIISARYEEISGMLNSHHNSLTATDELNIILFDYNDTVDISNTTNLIYLPGLENDVVNLQSGSETKSVKIKSNGAEVDSTTYGFGQYFTIDGKNYVVWGLGGLLLNEQPPSSEPSYTVTPSATSVNEGSIVTFVVNTTNVADATDLYWTLGTVSGTISTNDFTTSINGSLTINSDTGNTNVTIKNDIKTEGSETFVLQIRTDSVSGPVVATSSHVTINDTSLTLAYTLSLSPSGVIATVLHDANGTGYVVGDQVTLAQSHLMPAGQTGTGAIIEVTSVTAAGGVDGFTLINGGQNFVPNDTTNDNDYWEARGGSGNDNFRVVITQVEVSVFEGATVLATVVTENIPDGTTLNYNISPLALRGEVTPNSGYFSVNNNTGSFSFVAKRDIYVGPIDTIGVKIQDSSYTVVASTSLIIRDVPFSLTASLSTTIVNENSTVTVTVNFSDAPDGSTVTITPIDLTTSGSPLLYDIVPAISTVTINNNVASSDFTIVRDGLTEGTEQLKFRIQNDLNEIIGYTEELTIIDSSFVGKNFDNKTFGPISVNRDSGNAAIASDWYNICGLDSIPNNSKIAIFIDQSGSMNMNTIQASYDKLADKLNERGISFITVTNGSEDWITPFDVDLD